MTDEAENEKLVRAFYEATVPGHREALRGIQSPHVVYDLPAGMPIACGHFDGLQDVLERFLANFYLALDVRFIAEEFIAARDEVVALGRIEGKNSKSSCADQCALRACLDGPKWVSPTTACFHVHGGAHACVGKGLNEAECFKVDKRSRQKNSRILIQRAVHEVCDKYNDVATASLIEVWIDESEKRTCFLAEINHDL